MFVVPVLNGAIGAEKLVRCGLTSLPPNLQPRQPLDFEPLYATDREREGSKRRAHFDTESVELGVGIGQLPPFSHFSSFAQQVRQPWRRFASIRLASRS